MPAIMTSEDAQYAFEIVKAICTEVGPGLPGSSQERERAAMIRKALESYLDAGSVVMEEFTLAPDAFLSPYPIAFSMIIAVLLNSSIGLSVGISPWLTAGAALAFSIMAPLLFILEFYLGFELVDPLFKKKQSINVIGKLSRPGTRQVKRLLLLSGHHDSAPENTWLRFLGYGFFFLSVTFFIGCITLLVMSIIQLAGVIAGNGDIVRAGTLGIALLAYPVFPAIIYILFATRETKNGGNVPGAVDNLAASALTVAMCRFLVRHPDCIPEDTEIRFVSFGSEEAGLRGSRRYVERHLDELRLLKARLLNFEMVAYPEIGILTSDLNGTLQYSPEMVASVVSAAERARVPYRVKPASIGVETDAVPFSKAGLAALTLLPFKVPQQTVAFYHTQRDTPDKLTIEPLLNVLQLALEWIRCGGE